MWIWALWPQSSFSTPPRALPVTGSAQGRTQWWTMSLSTCLTELMVKWSDRLKSHNHAFINHAGLWKKSKGSNRRLAWEKWLRSEYGGTLPWGSDILWTGCCSWWGAGSLQGRLCGCRGEGEGLGVSRERTSLTHRITTCPWLWCGAWMGKRGQSGWWMSRDGAVTCVHKDLWLYLPGPAWSGHYCSFCQRQMK